MSVFHRFVPVFFCAWCLAAGCTVIREVPPETAAVPSSPEYRKAVTLLHAFLADDGKKFVAALSPEMQKSFSVERFHATRTALVASFGNPRNFTYFARLDMPGFIPFIWKISFARETPDGQTVFSDVLFRVVVSRNDQGEAVIAGCQFL